MLLTVDAIGPILRRTLLGSLLVVASAPTLAAASARDDIHRAPEGLADSEWSSINAAYEADRHAATRGADGGHRARNPGQQWTTSFDGRGFTAAPDHGQWVWGLELVQWGYEGRECRIEGHALSHVSGQRVAYQWGAALTEWYVNDGRGLEHGFTVHARPDDSGAMQGELAFTLAVRGGLCAESQADGRGARFVEAFGATALNYSGLVAFDADGRGLPATIDASQDTVVIRVDDRGARYPLTIDPIAQQAYLKASNTDTLDTFGSSVAIFGDTVVVGAPGEDSAATGVNGDQASNSALGSGAAYVFVRNGTAWTQQAYLKASNAEALDAFGASVAISGDTIVVGANNEDSHATGANGDQASNSASDSGAAYVFVRTGTAWTQQAYLKASNTEVLDVFGISVAIYGDTIVVGAAAEDSASTGVDGDQISNGKQDSGAAYVFARNGTTWTQQAFLKASNTDASDAFGTKVNVFGGTIVVGADKEDSAAIGVDGNQASNSASDSGAAYVFVRNGTAWTQQAYLKASNTEAGDSFGGSVAASGDTVVVGAGGESSAATSVNGDQSNNDAVSAGAAYVFVRSGSIWAQQAYLKAFNTGSVDSFGKSVSASGDSIVIGAALEDSAVTGINGDQTSNAAPNSGAAYVFLRDGTTWTQHAYLKASNTGANDFFGWAVSVSGETVVVGARTEDGAATGVNGDQTSNDSANSGAVYMFGLADCNQNGTADVADIAAGTSLDCNSNGIPDECDIANGCGVDANGNGVLDQCEVAACTADLNGDGVVNGADLGILLGAWGQCAP